MLRTWQSVLCCLLILTWTSNMAAAVKREAKVIILGAGMSGIMAAKTLKELGVEDIVILEGSAELGGRIQDVTMEGHMIGMGPEFIYGACLDEDTYNAKPTDPKQAGCNPIFALANKYGVTYTEDLYESEITRNRDGDDVSPEAAVEYESYVEASEQAYQRAVNLLAEEKPDISLATGLRIAGWVAENPVSDAVEHWEVDIQKGQPSETTSLKHSINYDYKHFGQYDLYVHGEKGLNEIVKAIAREEWNYDPAVESDTIQTGHMVTTIAQNDTKVTATTNDGVEYVADYIIVTASIGVLQSGDLTFQPALPLWKMASIEQFHMSHTVSVTLHFMSTFWDDKEWILYADSMDGKYPLWHNLNHIYPNSHILRVLITGKEARRVQSLTEHAVWLEVKPVLGRMYDGVNVPNTKPTMMVTAFSNNNLFYGSFSNWPTGYTDEYHEALTKEVGRIFFAGEALSYDYHGTMTGAYYSGIQQAERLIRCLWNECPAYVPRREAGGCMYEAANNYAAQAQYDDNSCQFDTCEISGASVISTSHLVLAILCAAFWALT